MHPSSGAAPSRGLIASLAATFAAACVAAQAAPPPGDVDPSMAPAPVEAYAAIPGAQGARLSPDGRYLAYIGPLDGHTALLIQDLEGKERTKALATGEGELNWVLWKSDHRLVISLRVVSVRTPLLKSVDTRLVALDRDGSHLVELVQADNGDFQPQIQDRIIGELPGDPDHLLLQMPAIDRTTRERISNSTINERNEHPEVVRVDLNTGLTQRIIRQHGLINEWFATPDGEVDLGWASKRDRSASLLARDPGTSAWNPVFTQTLDDGVTFEPLASVEGKPGHLYVSSNHETGHDAIYEFDTATARYVRTVAASPNTEVQPLRRDGRLLGYEVRGQRPVYLDPDWAADASQVNKALPDSINRIVDRSRDGRRVLVYVAKGNEPADYWTLTRNPQGPADLAPVTEAYPRLDVSRIAPSRWRTMTARDGLAIPVLVTLPRGYRPGSGMPALPFVVLPHGGPSSHDVRHFDDWAQFLASRGYGVLQPQFRGSTGYGRRFLRAGYRQWGLAMQDDVTDATRWIVQEGDADPHRIAIVGASYGGYAALMGVAREPDLYRCAIAIAPVTDLSMLVEDRLAYLDADLGIDQIGRDFGALERTSPDRLADRFRSPVLLIHGRHDYTVPVRHSELMESALRKAGKPVQAIYLDEADHYFTVEADRVRLMREIERFLAANMN